MLGMIDGLNGLSSGLAIITLLSFSYLVYGNDDKIFYNLILISSCLFGFFIINILTGKIFLGDGGSFFCGFIIAIFGILIVSKNASISPWTIFLIIIYPATELIFTFTRRIMTKKSPFKADNFHLHSNLYKISNQIFSNKLLTNSGVSVFLLAYASLPICLALYFKDEFSKTIITLLFFCLTYFMLYLISVKDLNFKNKYKNK